MIELTAFYANGTRDVHKFRDAKALTDYLMKFNESVKFGMTYYTIVERPECLRHEWMYVPLLEREDPKRNFRCHVCGGLVWVSDKDIDEIYVRQQDNAV